MEAQYSSRCPSCGERIEEGDEIFRDDELDAFVCEGCEPPPLRITKPKPAKKKGPSLAERLEANTEALAAWEPASVASPALKGINRDAVRIAFADVASLTAHDAVKLIMYEHDAFGIDAAADKLVNWAMAHTRRKAR
jgi:hypothetical protein